VTHAIVMLGTNDLRNRWAKPDEEVTGEQMIAGLQQMAVRAHSRGIKLIGATLTPFGNETFMADAWNPTREKHRVTVNKWIRESGAFDGVADFDAALRDPEIPTQMRAVDDCGDGLHPSDSGYLDSQNLIQQEEVRGKGGTEAVRLIYDRLNLSFEPEQQPEQAFQM